MVDNKHLTDIPTRPIITEPPLEQPKKTNRKTLLILITFAVLIVSVVIIR